MCDQTQAGTQSWYVTKPTRSTQPCIPPGSLNRVPALVGRGKRGNITSARWQETLCDVKWHSSSYSSEACCKALYLFSFTFHLSPCSFQCFDSDVGCQERHPDRKNPNPLISGSCLLEQIKNLMKEPIGPKFT